MLTILCRDAKVRRVRVHDLRHTCASLLLAQGVDARTIMETLGHSTITKTLDTYAHVMEAQDLPLSERRSPVCGTSAYMAPLVTSLPSAARASRAIQPPHEGSRQ
ncbi:tyrosine-type recombinase/integrase [Streptomyces sp. NPDC096012]|uniref:tyrosine-type recombinase/integrase n=1 Tax=Streptomyces sp. NPDC096012 TaxID=3155684 RepID=UPI00336ABA02